MQKLSNDPAEVFSVKKIFFGHQSVGGNIISGLEMLNQKVASKVYDLDQNPGETPDALGFYHKKVGRNNDPKSKISEFDKIVRETFAGQLDIAFVKLCYVDFNDKTDIDDVFTFYKNSLAQLQKDYPDITFVHFTTPLTRNPENWKTKLKKIFGFGDLWEYRNNVIRNEYSRMVLQEYSGKEPVFDIATYESTHDDGSRAQFSLDGQVYYSLAEELTSDGGHLNEKGSSLVAAKLAELLAEL